ncbi:mannose-1-phosphate guanylyltransferase [Kineococcus gynurae]|uniref:Mannose-1-phosphate guanylyltransferase n=1 Tax=Kineococcus gynurae TaxID=452979 RepID=A0ABV5LXK0_9ACTN
MTQDPTETHEPTDATGPGPRPHDAPGLPVWGEEDLEDAQIDLSDFYAVVPAGGAGTRLWPLSRSSRPKFLLDLTGRGRTLLQSTWDRLEPLATAERTVVVTGHAHADGVREQLPLLKAENVLAEPSRRDSAAAIGLAAAVLHRRDPHAVVGSFAADHVISGRDDFESSVEEAVVTARRGFVVTIGIAPSHPATGFGYIRLGKRLRLQGAPNARRVVQFKEKPDARTASSYLATGDYRWNGGMFVARADVLLELLSRHAPALHAGIVKIADAWDTPHREEVLAEQWAALPSIAIDHAVAEPAAEEGRVAVVPATFGWDDVGDFSSLAELLPADADEPRILGDAGLVVTEGVAGGVVVPASGRVVALLGVDDIVVVDTPDALLVTTRARSQEVKKLVTACEKLGRGEVV